MLARFGYLRGMRRQTALWLFVTLGCAGSARDLRLYPETLPPAQRADAEMVAAAYEAEPQDAAVLYQVASSLARAGRTEDALEALRRMAALETGVDPRPRDGFDSLVAHPEFRRIVAAIRAKQPPVLHAHEALALDEADLGPEGIAWSAKTKRLYLGSVKRKIVAADLAGHIETLVPPARGGLGVVLGLRVDDARSELWAASARLNGQPADALVGLLRVRLSDGEVLGRYATGTPEDRLAARALRERAEREKAGPTRAAQNPGLAQRKPMSSTRVIGSMAMRCDARRTEACDR
jgi:hypothetical protein